MVVALALMLLTGAHGYEALIGVGAVFTVLGMALFLFQVVTDGDRAPAPRPAVA